MSFRDRIEADRRLIILQLLVQAGGAASEGTLERGLLDLGERTELDRSDVRRFMDELEVKTCVRLDLVHDQTKVAEITKFGVAVAEGRKTVDGISKPQMGV